MTYKGILILSAKSLVIVELFNAHFFKQNKHDFSAFDDQTHD